MSRLFHLGIECGERGLRAAYSTDNGPVPLNLGAEASRSWVIFDPGGNISNIGVGFPGLIRRLASPPSVDPTNMIDLQVERRLAEIRSAAELSAGKQLGETVLAVPATLGHAKRQALLACARSAALGSVSIIDKCTAAAVGYHGESEQSRTVVVFDLDYGDFEYALVRLAMKRCRVIAAGAVPRCSGELFGALIMEAVVLALRNNPQGPIYLGLRQWVPDVWIKFHTIIETARQELGRCATTEVELLPGLTGLKQPLDVRILRDGFAERLRPLIDQTVAAVHEDFEQNKLQLADIDAFLCTGDTAQCSPVWEMLEASFEGIPQRTDENLIVVGAALHASHIAKNNATLEAADLAQEVQIDAPSSQPTRPVAPVDGGSVAKIAEVVGIHAGKGVAPSEGVERRSGDRSEPRVPSKEASQDAMSLDAVRNFVRAGELDGAEALLDLILRESNALRETIKQERQKLAPRLLIKQARALLNAGEFQGAVGLSHQAYEQAITDPDIFEEMIQVHVDAGMKLDRPQEYEQSKKILLCAQSHDQTNRVVHKALARRHYQHAVAIRDNRRHALEAVNAALSFDPKHPEANELLRELSES